MRPREAPLTTTPCRLDRSSGVVFLAIAFATAGVAICCLVAFADGVPSGRPNAQRVSTPGGLPPLTAPARTPSSFVEAPPFDEDRQAFARMRASRDPAIVEMVRLMDERERRLAALRARRSATTDPMAILALQREAQEIKLDCERGMMVAQLDRARVAGLDVAATELARQIAAFDQRRATVRALLAAPARAGRTR